MPNSDVRAKQHFLMPNHIPNFWNLALKPGQPGKNHTSNIHCMKLIN